MKGLGKLGLWACGVLFGTAGISILKSDDAKTGYTHVTAAAKRGGASVMKTYTTLKENIDDISADADDINEERARQKEAREIAAKSEFIKGIVPEDILDEYMG